MPRVMPPNYTEQESSQFEGAVSKGELGSSGVVILEGVVTQEEHITELTGEMGLEVWEKMARSDGTIKSVLTALKLPILAAHWFVEPASNEPNDILVAQFVEKNLMGDMTITWQETLREALRYLEYGVYLFEKVFRNVEFENNLFIGLKKLAPRLPRTVYAWQTEDKKDGITQHLDTGEIVSIPMTKLLILVNDKVGDDWWGESILRPAWKHWEKKEKLENIDTVKHERQGLGIPYFKKPPGASPKDKAKARKLLKNLRAYEQGYLEWPDGWDFGFLDMKVKTTTDILPSVSYHDDKIVQSVLAQFLHLGQKQTGSFALSKDQSSFFYLGLKSKAEFIAEVFSRYVIKQLVDFNFFVESYPRLSFESLGAVDYNTLSTALERYSRGKFLVPDVMTEQFLRHQMGLPELDEETLKKRIEHEKAELERMFEGEPKRLEIPEPSEEMEMREDFKKNVSEMRNALHKFIERNESNEN